MSLELKAILLYLLYRIYHVFYQCPHSSRIHPARDHKFTDTCSTVGVTTRQV